MNGKILLFQISGDQTLEMIRRAVQGLDVALRPVRPEELGHTVGELALLPPAAGGAQERLREPMMVLCMPPRMLERVLLALRQAGVPPICKAVLTATNAGWTPAQLLRELQRERDEIQKRLKK